jgi:transcriptional regulator with XRE-family HTH domain
MSEISSMTFAEWLLLKRRKKGIRQEDLAKVLDLSHQTVSSWETGRGIPRLDPRQTRILCKTLGCDLEDLAEAFGEVNPTKDCQLGRSA